VRVPLDSPSPALLLALIHRMSGKMNSPKSISKIPNVSGHGRPSSPTGDHKPTPATTTCGSAA
jgi:hypothetical protein